MKRWTICLIVLLLASCSINIFAAQKIHLKKILSLYDASADEKFVFGFPRGGVMDAKGCLYVFDAYKKKKLVKLDPQGRLIWEFGILGQGPGDLQRPQSVDIHIPSNTVFLLDQGNRKVLLLNSDGEFIREIRLTESASGPLAMAVDSKKNIYIQFFSAHNGFLIHRYSHDGTYMGGIVRMKFSNEKERLGGEKNHTRFCIDRNDNIVLAFKLYNLIQVVKPDGTVVKEWKQELPFTPKTPKYVQERSGLEYWDADTIVNDIAVDAKDNIYLLSGAVGDEKGMRIDVLSNMGERLVHFYSNVPHKEKLQEISIDGTNHLIIMNLLSNPAITVYEMSWGLSK